MRLNGWQRIGIVASILWAVVGYHATMEGKDWASGVHQACLASAPYSDSIKRGEHINACSRDFQRDLPIAIAQLRNDALIMALVPIPIGWMVTYFIVGVVRWVRRGFNPAS